MLGSFGYRGSTDMWPNPLRFLSRIRYAWARQRIDEESRREFDTHLDLLVDRYTRLGMTLEEVFIRIVAGEEGGAAGAAAAEAGA